MPSPLSSPRFPQAQGFMPLATGNMDPETDIPLAPMRTTSSARRRKQAGGLGPELAVSTSTNEKHGLFHHSSRLAGRRKTVKPGQLTRQGSDDSEVALNFMGKLYTRIIGASAVTRYLIYVIPVAILLAVPLVILPLTDNAHTIPLGHVTTDKTTTPPTVVAGPPLFYLFVWIEASWASLWAGKLAAHLLPSAFIFFCGVVSSGTRKYATVLRALEIPFSLFFWGMATWLVFKFLFTDDDFEWIYVVKNILGSLFVSSAVFLVEKAFVQLISISYHNRSFANRIKESKHEIHLLGLMYDASRTLFPMYCREFADEDYAINDSFDGLLGGSKSFGYGGNSARGLGHGPSTRGHHKSASVVPMRLIGNVGRFGDKVTSVFGNLASEITGKQVFNPNSAHSIIVEALEKVRSSEALARRIWLSFVVEDRDSLLPEDIEEVLGAAHKEDAEECFIAIDADGNGDISLEEMVRKVVDMGKERKAIANSMKDISQALAVFDRVLLFVVLLIVIFIFLAFFQSSFISTLTTAGTTLLSLSFIFSVTAQEFLGSCIFLFVKHPYDVGDRVDINGPEKEQLIVEKISLLFTVFMRTEHRQVVQVPNIVLNTLWIENVTRSTAMCETLDVNVSYDTSFEDVELLRLEMEKFVRDPDNARDFYPDITIGVSGVGDLDKLQLKITMQHKSNWHNDTVRATRRSKFMCALALALKKVPISNPGGGSEPLGGPANPQYSVTVSDADAIAARDKFKKDKDEKRMVPLLDLSDDDDDDNKDKAKDNGKDNASTGPGSRQAEKQAVRELNSNSPTALAAAAAAAEAMNFDGAAAAGDGDDHTLNEVSREPSFERGGLKKSQSKASTVHTKSMSQRGRRQAGQGLPPMPLGEDLPPAELERYTSVTSIQSSRRGGPSFDLERGNGGASTGGVGLAGVTIAEYPTGEYAAEYADQHSGQYPGPATPSSAYEHSGPPHPLQSQPTAALTGNRVRGASLSRYPPRAP